MRHPIATAALATSTTVLVASLRDARPSVFFFALGIACFAVARIVRDAEVPDLGPLVWMIAGAVHLAAYAALREVHPTDAARSVLAALGLAYLILGTVAWMRARFS